MIYLKLFLTFLKIGAFTFGGGYAMLPLIEEEVVKNEWLSIEELVNFIAVSESTPGPFAINTATYVGSEVGGFFGSVCATAGVVLPSFVIILIIARFFIKFSSNRYVKGLMSGLKPTVVGLIGSALLSLFIKVVVPSGFKNIQPFSLCVSIAIFGIMLFLSIKKKHPILIIVLSAVIGIAAGYIGEFADIGILS